MTRRCRMALAAALLAGGTVAQAPAEVTRAGAAAPWPDAPSALRVDLAGAWEAWLDPSAIGLSDGWVAALTAREPPPGAPGEAFAMDLPAPLESVPGLELHDGVAWFARDVELPPQAAGARALLRLEQVNDVCHAFWDGEPLGAHEGGYDAFVFELPPRLSAPGAHRLVLMVLDTGATETFGRTLRTVPHAKEDWYENVGGVLGPMAVELRAGWSLRELRLRPDAAAGTLAVQAAAAAPRGARAGDAVDVVLEAVDADGVSHGAWEGRVPVQADGLARCEAVLALSPQAPRWTPESPGLLTLRVALDGAPAAERRFGLRRFELRDGDVFLEGRRRVLKGVLWQPHFTGTGGMVPPAGELEAEVRAMRAAGFDLVRAHVRPAPPAFLDACDRLGLMVLEEPAIGWVDDHPDLPARLLREVEWMVERDAHHPSIVLWGVLNELSGRAFRHADALVARVAELDPTRGVLRDSGGFLGARWRPPGAPAEQPMTDLHIYPPWPLPPERRDELATAGTGAEGPAFVSEYGYGTLLDAARADAGFRARRLRNEEGGRFRSFARTAAEAAAGEAWWARLAPADGGWLGPAGTEQAEALLDMTDALRSNPALDLLCLTQWRAVSSEPSAGLLDPWGEERQALAAMREALAPRRALLLPERASLRAGEALRLRLVLVNDGDATTADVLVEWRASSDDGGWQRRELAGVALPEGLGTHELELPAPTDAPGGVVARARLRPAGGEWLEGSVVELAVEAPPALSDGLRARLGPLPRPLVWTPDDEPAAQELLARLGVLAASPGEVLVALLPRPETLPARLDFDQRLGLEALAARGGVVVALASDPGADLHGRLTAAARGLRTLVALPVPVAVAPAAGNFSGRFHVLRRDAGAQLMGRGHAALSPVAMLVGAPAPDERIVTLGFAGNRIGAPWAVLPAGAGTLHVLGLPLLDPVRGAPDAQREAFLARVLDEALGTALDTAARLAADGQPVPPPWKPLEPAAEVELRAGLELLERLVALGDRATPFTSAGGAPRRVPQAERLLAARDAALRALLAGDAPAARETLRAALEPEWTGACRDFVAGEARVLDELARLTQAGPSAWGRAWDGVDAWSRALAAWFGGREREALDELGRAERLLGLQPAPADAAR